MYGDGDENTRPSERLLWFRGTLFARNGKSLASCQALHRFVSRLAPVITGFVWSHFAIQQLKKRHNYFSEGTVCCCYFTYPPRIPRNAVTRRERERGGYKETPRCVVLNRETVEAKFKKRKKKQSHKQNECIDVTLCSPVESCRRFGGTYYLQLQGRNISQGHIRKEKLTGNKLYLLLNFWFLHVFSWFLNMDAVLSFENEVNIQNINSILLELSGGTAMTE